MNRIDLKAAAAAINGARDVLILTHKNPDGDTLGAAFALWDFFRAKNVKAQVRCSDEIPAIYRVITDQYSDGTDELEPRYTVAVDCSDAGRMGRYSETAVDLCIDHHESQRFFAANTLLEEHSASCCEIMLKLFDEAGWSITKYAADCLYVGVSTDTGCFRFANTDDNTHRAAARLIAAGADAYKLNVIFFMTRSKSRLAVERGVFESLELRCDDRVAFITISEKLLEQTGATPGDLEGISDIPLTVEGVSVGVTVKEISGGCKVSLRTRGVDACGICAVFGGGGHFNASGFETSMTSSEIKDALTAEISRRLDLA